MIDPTPGFLATYKSGKDWIPKPEVIEHRFSDIRLKSGAEEIGPVWFSVGIFRGKNSAAYSPDEISHIRYYDHV